MHKWILLVTDNKLLEIVERQIVVTQQVGAFTAENVSFEERLVELECHRQVLQCLIKDTQAGVGSSTSQMELSSGLLFFLDRYVEVT